MSDNDELMHHGTKGMKWGVWNAETAARYAGVTKTFVKNKVNNFTSKAKESHEQKKAVAAAEKAAKKQQKEFDSETRKRYGLSGKQYNELRTRTLNSNDPSVVAKGMHLLTDKELVDKIDRLEKENKIRKIATSKEDREAKVRQAKAEARSKTLPYVLGKAAGNAAINAISNKVLQPGTKELYSRLRESVQRTIKDQAKSQEKAQEKADKKKEVADKKKEADSKKRKEEAAKATEKTIKTLSRQEYEDRVYSNPDHFRDEEWYRKARKRLS